MPPKIKNLLWRCARNVLPVRDNLRSKRVWIGRGCPMCGYMVETLEHLFCDCVFGEGVWGAVNVLQGRDFASFLTHVIGRLSVEEAWTLAAVFWTIWTARNDVVWHNKIPERVNASEQMLRLQLTWKEAYAVQRPTVRHAPEWISPPCYTVKCNVDAALSGEGASFGAVVRDHNGGFVAAKSGQMDGVVDPYMAEALGVKEALTWLKAQHHKTYGVLVFPMSREQRTVWLMSIARDIWSVSVSHVKRTANCVAHGIARATGSLAASGVWFDIPPACIVNYFNQ
ncbi:PREDICTED: uncharacterized protein LOC109152494 [Ipomoea nil]|uniref:uncharacterized protein LOC109152494 n=1 Tax=Ipomoea nil TaxID=35883 RepID=UPI000900F5DE|nr:PREDICTED: uncharacterized protein LOC109152494 [Ipomoea nil]